MKQLANYQPHLIQLQAAEGVGYGGRAIIKLPNGITLDTVEILTNLVNRKTLKRVAVDLGGNEVMYASGEDLHTIDQFLGKHTESGRFVIDFARFEYRNIVGIRQRELITLPSDDTTLILDFDEKQASDPDTLTCKGMAWVHNTDTQRYFLPTMYKLTQNIPAAGEHEFIFPNSAINRWVQRLTFDETNMTVSKIEIWSNSTKWFEGSRQDVEFALQRHSNKTRNLVTGKFIFDFTLLGMGRHGAYNTGTQGSFIIKLWVDGGGAMPVLVEGFKQVAIPQATT